jgi:Flp pilus assembly pilin Flp
MLNLALSNYLRLLKALEREEGQDLIEYSLIIVLIVLVAIVGMSAVGDRIAEIWDLIVTALT